MTLAGYWKRIPAFFPSRAFSMHCRAMDKPKPHSFWFAKNCVAFFRISLSSLRIRFSRRSRSFSWARPKSSLDTTSVSRCADNAAVETFFKTIKPELIWQAHRRLAGGLRWRSSNTSTASTIHAAVTQHWVGKAQSLSNARWLKRALRAALKRDGFISSPQFSQQCCHAQFVFGSKVMLFL